MVITWAIATGFGTCVQLQSAVCKCFWSHVLRHHCRAVGPGARTFQRQPRHCAVGAVSRWCERCGLQFPLRVLRAAHSRAANAKSCGGRPDVDAGIDVDGLLWRWAGGYAPGDARAGPSLSTFLALFAFRTLHFVEGCYCSTVSQCIGLPSPLHGANRGSAATVARSGIRFCLSRAGASYMRQEDSYRWQTEPQVCFRGRCRPAEMLLSSEQRHNGWERVRFHSLGRSGHCAGISPNPVQRFARSGELAGLPIGADGVTGAYVR